jgi:hypothetical protein
MQTGQRTMDPSLALAMSSFMPWKSRPIVFLSKYLVDEHRAMGRGMNTPVSLNLQADGLSDGDVVSPGWVGDPDVLDARVELGEEASSDSETSRSRDGLGDGDLGSVIMTGGAD